MTPKPLPDKKPSLDEILKPLKDMASYALNDNEDGKYILDKKLDRAEQAILAYFEGLVPERRNSVGKLNPNLRIEEKAWVNDGWNACVDQFHKNIRRSDEKKG